MKADAVFAHVDVTNDKTKVTGRKTANRPCSEPSNVLPYFMERNIKTAAALFVNSLQPSRQMMTRPNTIGCNWQDGNQRYLTILLFGRINDE